MLKRIANQLKKILIKSSWHVEKSAADRQNIFILYTKYKNRTHVQFTQ